MKLWTSPYTLAEINLHNGDSAATHLGIRFTAVGDDWLEAELQLDERTRRSDGAFDPGSMSMMVETVASVAAALTVAPGEAFYVGQAIAVHHLTATKDGPIRARATREYGEDREQLWQVDIRDANDRLVCSGRVTMARLSRQP